nr:12260_t:CDS:10 [Entrophospora candida]
MIKNRVTLQKSVDMDLDMDLGVNWKKGDPVPYSVLCKTFEMVESTTKRLEKQDYLVTLFALIIENTPENLLDSLYLCINRVGPDYENVELGIGESLLIRVIADTTGRKTQAIKEELAKWGDLGKDSKSTQPTLYAPKPLTIPSVLKSMKKIAHMNGQDSQERKVREIRQLLASCKGEESKYLIRSLEGKLRIGLAAQTVLISLAQAIVYKDPGYEKLPTPTKIQLLADAPIIVKAVYSEIPSYDMMFLLKLFYNNKKGIPLKPMLAFPTKSITEVLDRVEGHKFTCEFKYDGEHNSVKFPDIIEKLSKFVKHGIKSFILDCEVVAWDLEKDCLLPFQVLSTRKRKDVKGSDIKVKVCLFAFDLLYLNGESLLKKPLIERRELLYNSFQEIKGEFAFAHEIIATNTEEIQSFLDESVKNNCEGTGDSLDLVVIGADYGRGKRTNFYGTFLLACFDPDNEEYQTICKLGTGFSDADLETHYKFLKEHEIEGAKSYYNYDKATKPDVWFEPCQVWEIKAADISKSPIYKAAIGQADPSKGVSLRFPRFVRIRTDKKPEEATTNDQVADMYNSQFNNGAE